MFYVSEYSVDRRYGGPEEGGWWYDEETFVTSLDAFHTLEEAVEQARTLNERQQKQDREDGHIGRGSVIGGPDTVFYAESHPAEYQTLERPRYE